MRPEFYAVLTAICWAVGSVLEKRGIHEGHFTPIMGVGIRTFFSLIFLSFFTFPYWGELKVANGKSFLYIMIGGGLIAGCLGIVFLYSGLKTGNISTILAIAFCLTPLFGALIGYIFLKENLSVIQICGIIMCLIGAALVAFNRNLPPINK